MEAAGLYIHIPFCVRKCAYCDFVSCTDVGEIPRTVTLLSKEMALISEIYGRLPIQTVFLGGGTPSLLSGDQVAGLLDAASAAFSISTDAEISMEANPGTLDAVKLRDARRAGVNRLSIGAQAAQDRLLTTLGRIHRWPDVLAAAAMARDAGFDNLNFDLMYGLPEQAPDDWALTLEQAVALAPTHLSCYELILEPGTPLALRNPVLPDEETVLTMAEMAETFLGEAGLARYEISNYAKVGFRCRHNLLYWNRGSYAGVGPAAHSFLNGVRMGNEPSLERWSNDVAAGRLRHVEETVIGAEEARFETMMLGLRLTDGIDLEEFTQTHDRSPFACWGEALQTMKRQGLLDYDAKRLWLTRRGLAVQNAVLTALL